MALRLEDEDERISNLAKLFFTELAKKGETMRACIFMCTGKELDLT